VAVSTLALAKYGTVVVLITKSVPRAPHSDDRASDAEITAARNDGTAGFAHMTADRWWRFVVLLGHDHGYPRFGFAPAAARRRVGRLRRGCIVD